MATQNLVSASLSPETRADVMEKLAAIKKSLGFLLTLKTEQKQSLFKVGNGYAPFVEQAYDVVMSNPEILPVVFDSDEFKKDYRLSKDLTAIVNQMRQLVDSLDDTLVAVSSDAITEALEVYSAVKQNSNRVPGLKVAETEMAEFFKKPKRKTAVTV
jgi:hypothetical protein